MSLVAGLMLVAIALLLVWLAFKAVSLMMKVALWVLLAAVAWLLFAAAFDIPLPFEQGEPPVARSDVSTIGVSTNMQTPAQAGVCMLARAS